MIISLPPHVCACIETLEQAGYEAWAVGGCVRDLLRGVNPHDYDLTTSALPVDTMRLFPHVVPTGLPYGTVSVITPQGPLEVTTFRTETAYLDFRRPSGVIFASRLRDDLSRRDFTVNAMAYTPAKGLCDFFGGEADLKARVIRAVGEPALRFQEDALRVLRAFRFASQLDFVIEEDTITAALSWGKNLSKISAERVAAELVKALMGSRPSRLFPLLKSGALAFCGLMPPNITSSETFDRLPLVDSLRLASLCFLCSAQVRPVCAALKMSNALQKAAAAYQRQLTEPAPRTRSELKQRFSKLPPECWGGLLQARALLLGEKNEMLREQWKDVLAKREPWCLSQLAVNGNDLRALGILPGRETGNALQMLLQAVMEHPEWNTKEKLLEIVSKRMDHQAGG